MALFDVFMKLSLLEQLFRDQKDLGAKVFFTFEDW